MTAAPNIATNATRPARARPPTIAPSTIAPESSANGSGLKKEMSVPAIGSIGSRHRPMKPSSVRRSASRSAGTRTAAR